ncbi:MAG: DUF2171 domain-containing protein [Sphingomicrobium sp.]
MAYDRYDTRRDQERGRYSDHDRERYQGRGSDEDRGFFERAGDEIASWFGDDDAERRREDGPMGRGRGRDNDRFQSRSSGGDWDRSDRAISSRDSRSGYGGGNDRGYRSSGYGGSDYERRDFERSGSGQPERSWGRGEHRRSESGTGRDHDPNYQSWRERQLDELDRDYEEYRRERQEKFESDFGKWRQNRQQKRGLLGQIREHMDVTGSDGETIGKVDCVKGDRIVLTKSDSEDNRHHSIKCTTIDTVEGDQVRLDIPAEEAKSRWKDEDERGFFRSEEEDRDVNLERSFSGTYR